MVQHLPADVAAELVQLIFIQRLLLPDLLVPRQLEPRADHLFRVYALVARVLYLYETEEGEALLCYVEPVFKRLYPSGNMARFVLEIRAEKQREAQAWV